MYHGDAEHSGLSRAMPDVSGALKVVGRLRLDGAVYASPIAVDGVIVVATENDSVYGFDAPGKQLWHVRVGTPSPGLHTGKVRWQRSVDLAGATPAAMQQARVGARPGWRSAARPRPCHRADARAGAGRRDQPLRHTRDLRQPGAGAHP